MQTRPSSFLILLLHDADAHTDASRQWIIEPRNTGGDYDVKANGYGSLVTSFNDGVKTVTQLLLRPSPDFLADNVAHGTLVATGVR